MIHGIIPLVKGGRRREGALVCLVFALSGGVGGAVAGLMTWLALTPVRTLLPRPVLLGLFLCSVSAAFLVDVRVLRNRLTRRRQVRQSLYGTAGPVKAYLVYGFSLGAGLVTYVPVASTYVVLLAAGLFAPITVAAAVGSAFGLGRTVVAPLFLHGGRALRHLEFAFAHRSSVLGAVSAALCCVVALVAA